jgi:hypothetical protein
MRKEIHTPPGDQNTVGDMILRTLTHEEMFTIAEADADDWAKLVSSLPLKK